MKNLRLRKYLFASIFSLVLLVNHTMAQSYGSALGIRFGHNDAKRTIGASYKHRIMKKVTLEGIFQTDFNHNTTFHANIARHRGFLTKRFNIYVGTGISFGKEESMLDDLETKEVITTYGNTTIGADLILGIEFTLLKHNFSIDYKPNFNLIGREPWYQGQVGVTARGVLITGAKQNKNRKRRIKARKKRQRQKAKDQRLKEKDREKDDSENEEIDNERPWLENLFKKKEKH